MEHSEEIRRLVSRWITAISSGDVDSVVGRMSDNPGALSVGTDPDEWWHGDEASAIWTRQFEEAGPYRFEPGPIEAWEEGTVGWAAAHVTIDLGDTTRDARLTCVLHLERDEWKIVQHHTSIAQPNEELFGATLTVSLEQLEHAVRRERPDLSAESAADGTVTIAFTDIVDSTVLNARLGDHAWREVLLRHRKVIAQPPHLPGGGSSRRSGTAQCLRFRAPVAPSPALRRSSVR